MKIKLHNKYEVTINGKTYTAYNTLLKGVYNQIGNLKQFTSHIAIGTGTISKSFDDSKLGSYLRTFETQTEEISANIINETLYIKKTVVLDQNDSSTFSFSELGLTNTDTFDPEIFNHVVLTNTDGKAVSITRNAGEVLQISVTIYLTLNNLSTAKFTLGENLLIKQILGENLNLSDNNLYVMRGEDLTDNSQSIYRLTPQDLSTKVACSKKINISDQSIDITFECELGEGKTEELLLIYGDQVCMRLNTINLLENTQTTQTLTPSASNCLELGENVKSVDSVYDTSSASLTTDYTLVKYGNRLTEKITNLFDVPFTSSTPYYVAKDGGMIAFIHENSTYVYKVENGKFTKINTTQVPTNNILNILMFSDIILVVLKESPYMRLYLISDNIAIEKELSLETYELSAYSFDWLKVDGVLTSNNKILLGLIINNEEQSPLIMTISKQASKDVYYDLLTRPSLSKALDIYTINQTPYTEATVAFVSDELDGEICYTIEEFTISGSQYGPSSEDAFNLISQVDHLSTAGRNLLVHRNISPYLYLYYYPEMTLASETISTGIEHYGSSDGNYIISKYEDGTFKIFNLHNFNEFTEFESGLPNFVTQSEIVSFEFLKNILLVFTSNINEPIYAIKIKENLTRLDNTPNQASTYDVSTTNFNLMGTRDLEGVKLTLDLKFSNTTDTSQINETTDEELSETSNEGDINVI